MLHNNKMSISVLFKTQHFILLVLDSEEPPGGVTLYISNSKLNSLNVSYDISFSRAETVTLHVSCWPLWDDMLA